MQVLSSFVQPAIKQYLLPGVNQSPGLNTIPAVSLPYQQPVPSTGLSSLSSLSLPNLVSLLAQTGGNTVPTLSNPNFAPPPNVKPNTNLGAVTLPSISPPKSEGIDSSVLNNLAIAVQLLVLNNILNAPAEESKPTFEAFETMPLVKPSSYGAGYSKTSAASSQPSAYAMPNANFVGSSGFTESSMLGSSTIFPYGSPPPMSKSSMSLMSPYEALGPNSPFSDPILSSPYGSAITSKNDFQSPYTVMDNDLFSMSDFY